MITEEEVFQFSMGPKIYQLRCLHYGILSIVEDEGNHPARTNRGLSLTEHPPLLYVSVCGVSTRVLVPSVPV